MTLLCSIAAGLLPCCGAYALISAGSRALPRTPATSILRICLAIGAGLGLSSCTYFLWLTLFGKPQAMFVAVESLFWFLMVFVFRPTTSISTKSQPWPVVTQPVRPLDRWVLTLFMVIVASAIAGLVGQALAQPEGGWDAWAIWNLRARFLFHSGDDWRQALAGIFDHTDYPLLVPGSLARWWTFLGTDSGWVGAAFGIAFALGTVTIVATGVGLRRGRNTGLIAGMVLLGTVRFLRWGASQYADVPLAFFFLATSALLMLHDSLPREAAGSRLLFLAGLMAGLSAWTKNEGLLFVAVVLLVQPALAYRRLGRKQAIRDGLALFAGAAPVLAVVLLFKLQVPVSNDLVAGQGLATTAQKLFDPARHLMIVQAFFAGGLQVTHAFAAIVPLYCLLLGKRRQSATGRNDMLLPAGIVGLMLAGYYCAYLTTPHELHWHLTTSLDRLVVQLWPITICAIFLQVRAPEEALAEIATASAIAANPPEPALLPFPPAERHRPPTRRRA